MFLSLKIENLILIEKVQILFQPGFNILTGETGAGKSAVLIALRLIAGERADSLWIRENAPFAAVEAEIQAPLPVLEGEDPIELDPHAPITVRRELYRSGKNRCFLQERQVSLSALKQWVGSWMDHIGQESALSLYDARNLLSYLDIFSNSQKQANHLADSVRKERQLHSEILSLLPIQEGKTEQKALLEEELTSLEAAIWTDEEEKHLQEEHLRLTHSQQLQEKISQILHLLSEGECPLLGQLQSVSPLLEASSRIDPKLLSAGQSFKEALFAIQEVSHRLASHLDSFSFAQNSLEQIEQRIAQIEKAKRRFGRHPKDLLDRKAHILQEIDRLENLSLRLETLQKEKKEIEEFNQKEAQALSLQRTKAAQTLSRWILQELQELSLPDAQFVISLTRKPLQPEGIDEVSFLFCSHPHSLPQPLQQSASGGELARIFFAFKRAFAQKEQRSCLLFDEIDSHIGGETATLLADKLQTLSKERQIICITHFVQVAKKALHHLFVFKKDHVTCVRELPLEQRSIEYQRMTGEAHIEGI